MAATVQERRTFPLSSWSASTWTPVIFFKYFDIFFQICHFNSWYFVFKIVLTHCTEVRFTNFFSGGFITVIEVNPPKRKLAKRTSVHCEKKIVFRNCEKLLKFEDEDWEFAKTFGFGISRIIYSNSERSVTIFDLFLEVLRI